ncbi:MAG: tyrosine-type recombinase/integrase [Deltaproteobacteria bacterium]|nr:tyrosine-type recombinase/integrase [Deltaproteobacteria bacterium]
MGSLYQRGKKGIWWVQYYDGHGKAIRESAKTTKKTEAERLLKKREGDIAEGKNPGLYFDRVKFDELAEDFLSDYRINQKKSLVRAHRSIGHLKETFGGARITQITTPKIQAYIEQRLDQGAANASINRELAALKRMLNLGAKQTPAKVDRVPYIPMLKESNTRKGFFEHGDFLALREALPSYLKGFVTFAYKTGWRVSEIRDLKWNQVDREQGIVRLEPGESKNDEGRTVYLDSELKEVFAHQWDMRDNLIPFVFLNREHTDKIKDFRFAWHKAFETANIPKRLFHDFRRTAVRNLVRSGVSERVAMQISGHKTRSIFDRYNIVSDSDLRLAANRLEGHLEAQDVGRHKIDTISILSTKEGSNKND